MARVFSAVDIEDEKLLERLEKIRNRLDLGFRSVRKEKMHITLEFFGDVSSSEIKEIRQAMEDIEVGSFRADVKGLGVFPSGDYIRVVWAGAEAEQFRELYRQVSDHSVESDNSHDFVPHITLLRVKKPSRGQKNKLKKTLKEFKEHEFGRLKVSGVKLFESHLEGKNSYKTLHKKEL